MQFLWLFFSQLEQSYPISLQGIVKMEQKKKKKPINFFLFLHTKCENVPLVLLNLKSVNLVKIKLGKVDRGKELVFHSRITCFKMSLSFASTGIRLVLGLLSERKAWSENGLRSEMWWVLIYWDATHVSCGASYRKRINHTSGNSQLYLLANIFMSRERGILWSSQFNAILVRLSLLFHFSRRPFIRSFQIHS